MRDIQRSQDSQIAAVISVIKEVQPDILLLTQIDFDYQGQALTAFQAALKEARLDLPHSFTARPNSGVRTGKDMDSDGRIGPRDAQGFGYFPGDGGMAVLSRWPVTLVADLTQTLWTDPPEGLFVDPEQRVSSVAHWHLRVATSAGPLDLLTIAATPPVFDGPEDRNGHRNAAELALWVNYLATPLEEPFVLAGKLNVDPADGDGQTWALDRLLASGLIQDPQPKSLGGSAAADPTHRGDPAQDTADWPDPPEGPGNLRVDYILPSTNLQVTGSGVYWPGDDKIAAEASAHRLVWVDLVLP